MNKNSLRWITIPISKDKTQYFLELRDNETLSFHLFNVNILLEKKYLFLFLQNLT